MTDTPSGLARCCAQLGEGMEGWERWPQPLLCSGCDLGPRSAWMPRNLPLTTEVPTLSQPTQGPEQKGTGAGIGRLFL